MKLPPVVRGVFVRRENRFRAVVAIDEAEMTAHLPNSGRLTELLTPGQPVWLAAAHNPERRTRCDLVLVEYASRLVSVDARLPNVLWAETALTRPVLGQRFNRLEREVTRGASRLDFRLSNAQGVWWIEVKSVTLVERGLARFPDAPTERGRKHLLELVELVRVGQQAAMVFIVQRSDAERFAPHREADPAFAEALSFARQAGVGIWAYRCEVSLQEIVLADMIPVEG